MRRPQASFEAQPRAARLLAPKMGIGPYKQDRQDLLDFFMPCRFEHNTLFPSGHRHEQYRTGSSSIPFVCFLFVSLYGIDMAEVKRAEIFFLRRHYLLLPRRLRQLLLQRL